MNRIPAGPIDLSTFVTGVLGIVHGGTGVALADPNADRLLFWDDSAGAMDWLEAGSGLTISGTTLSANGGGIGGTDTQVQFNDGGVFGGDAGLTYNKTTNTLTMERGVITGGSGAADMLAITQPDQTTYGLTITNTTAAAVGGLYVANDGDFHIDPGGGKVIVDNFMGPTDFDGAVTITGFPFDVGQIFSTGMTGAQLHQIKATGVWNAMDGSATADGLNGIVSAITYGAGGIAAKGVASNVVTAMDIEGSGSASNEFAIHAGYIDVEIGTGFTQSTGPTGGFWATDMRVFGPIAVQPVKLLGHVLTMNNHYNGSPSASKAAGLNIVTFKGLDTNATSAAANTYPLDAGIKIDGVSDVGGTLGNGFTVGVDIGGGTDAYGTPSTRVGTAFKAKGITTTALDLTAFESTDLVIRLAADEGDDASDVWYQKVLASGNAMTWTNDVALCMTLTIGGLLSPVTMQPTTAYKSIDGTSGATGTSSGVSYKDGLATTITSIVDVLIEPAVDDTYSGPSTNDLNAGATIAQWDLVYLDSSSTWQLVDADAAATTAGMLALATTTGSAGNPLVVCLPGCVVRNDGWTWTAGAILYASVTPGGISASQPTGTDDVIRVIGYAVTDDCIYFDPSPDYITHT